MTINDLFNYLKDIFGNLNQQKDLMEEFQELNMRASTLDDFFSEFI